MLKKRAMYVIGLFTLLFLLEGCSTSQEDLDYYRKEFTQKTGEAFEALPNGDKVLAEVRREAQNGMKRTKVMNAIDQGQTALESMHDDLLNSPVPKEMEPAKKTLTDGIEKKIEAYKELFMYYDIQDKQHEQKADELLQEASGLIEKARTDVEKFKQ
jgi:hypothetical protein